MDCIIIASSMLQDSRPQPLTCKNSQPKPRTPVPSPLDIYIYVYIFFLVSPTFQENKKTEALATIIRLAKASVNS